MSTSKYPELDKQKKVHKESQSIGLFLDWLDSKGYRICEFLKEEYKEDEYGEWTNEAGYYPIHKSILQLLAMYYGIDLKKLEEERSQMLEEIRKVSTLNK